MMLLPNPMKSEFQACGRFLPCDYPVAAGSLCLRLLVTVLQAAIPVKEKQL